MKSKFERRAPRWLSPAVRSGLEDTGIDAHDLVGTGADGRVTVKDVRAAAALKPFASGSSRNGREMLSPFVRRLVADHGIDVGPLRGTGAQGRVTGRDVQQARSVRPIDDPSEAPLKSGELCSSATLRLSWSKFARVEVADDVQSVAAVLHGLGSAFRSSSAFDGKTLDVSVYRDSAPLAAIHQIGSLSWQGIVDRIRSSPATDGPRDAVLLSLYFGDRGPASAAIAPRPGNLMTLHVGRIVVEPVVTRDTGGGFVLGFLECRAATLVWRNEVDPTDMLDFFSRFEDEINDSDLPG